MFAAFSSIPITSGFFWGGCLWTKYSNDWATSHSTKRQFNGDEQVELT